MLDRDRKIIIVIFVFATILVLLLLGLILSLLFLYRKKQQGFAIELEQIKINYEKESLKTQLEIQEQTFHYISQEIHDNIGQFISLAKLHLNTLNFNDMALTRQQIGNSTDLLTKALDDLRDLSKSLSSEIIRDNGLTRAIELQITQLKKLEYPEVVYEIRGDYQYLDEQKEIFILRILQEAINNVLRHSEATRIEILLSYRDNNLSLLVRDDGKGFDKSIIGNSKTSGINNMMKRASMIEAFFFMETMPGKGTQINITVPY